MSPDLNPEYEKLKFKSVYSPGTPKDRIVVNFTVAGLGIKV